MISIKYSDSGLIIGSMSFNLYINILIPRIFKMNLVDQMFISTRLYYYCKYNIWLSELQILDHEKRCQYMF